MYKDDHFIYTGARTYKYTGVRKNFLQVLDTIWTVGLKNRFSIEIVIYLHRKLYL